MNQCGRKVTVQWYDSDSKFVEETNAKEGTERCGQMLSGSIGPWVLALIVLSIVCSRPPECPAQGSDSSKTHHMGDRFKNIYDVPSPGFGDFLRWRWDRLWMDIPGAEAYDFPLAENDPAFLASNREKATVTWIGHATVLVQFGGKNILTDPHFSERASPVQWAGPRRVVAPGLSLEALPPIDIVVISHDHYDSLDEQSILKLLKRPGGDKTKFFVPLGLKSWFEDLGVDNVTELDWWESRKASALEVIAVPVHHWSKRGLRSRNRTLWAGWVLRTRDFSFFFAGDSGYNPLFKEIGRRLGPFDLAAIPIGAYEPRWFMRYHHMSPEEAVKVHQDVRAGKSVGIHWGTFMLTDEPLDEPPKRLERALTDRNLSNPEFLVLKHGETVVLDAAD
jgi:N-acyl-phosphatidylethanolamine-hydrolysing phospholipase D